MTGLTWVKLVLLGGAAAGAFGAALVAVDYVESRNGVAVNAELAAAGLDWVSATSDGMQIVLSGTAPDEAQRFRALTIAGRAANPAHIRDRMLVTSPQDLPELTFELEILRNGDSVLMHGLIPTGDERRDDIPGRLSALAPDLELSQIVTRSIAPASENWRKAVDLGLRALHDLNDARIEITATSVTVDGVAPSGPAAATWEERFRDDLPEGIEVAINLRQPRPRLSPYLMRATLAPGEALQMSSCAAETEADVAQIEAAFETAGGASDGFCTLALGAPNRAWPSATEAALSALKTMGAGAVTLSDATVTVLPGEGVTDEGLAEAGEELRLALPQGYRLSLMPVQSGDADQGPVLRLRRSADGPVTLQGPVRNAQDEAVLASLAAARFGADNLTRVLRLSDELPQGWDLRAMAAAEALAILSDGQVEVTADAIRVEGTSVSEHAAQQITADLMSTLGPDQRYLVDVAYAPPPEGEDQEPDPQLCVDAVNDVLLEHKIVFEPGEVALGGEGLSTVGEIAEILQECPDIAMEIGGHTDSQGGEEMNQLLSQARAEAVLSALAARRVLTSSLTAKGYGESQPIADNGTEAGREANRRIAFRIVSETGSVSEEEAQNGAD